MSPPAICCGTRPSLDITRPANPPMRIFRPLRSSGVLISLRNQPPIWQPELPAVLHAAVETERHRGPERECRIFAEIVIRGGVAHFDRAGGHRVRGLQA